MASRMLRTFVAIRCEAGVCRRLRKVCDELAALDGGFRPPRTDDFHLTLQFLGDTEETDVPAIGRALAEATRSVPPFGLHLRGLGAFPDAERARVVWAGAREPEEEAGGHLATIARAVGARLGELGHPPEARAFHPHVTLGRLRRRPEAALVRAVEAARDRDLGAQDVSVLELILSQPGERGYHYMTLTSAALGGSPEAGT